MRRSYFFLSILSGLLLAAGTSCKKERDLPEPGEMVLSKIFRNGIPETEYLYSAGKITRINYYNEQTGKISGYDLLTYDNRGYLESNSHYNPEGGATSERTYIKDGDGKFIAIEFKTLYGVDSGKVTIRYKIEYNANGLVSKYSWNDPVTDKEQAYRLFFYYPNGNLKRYEYYSYDTGVDGKAYEEIYSPAGKTPPENIVKHKIYPVNFLVYLFTAEKIQYKSFDWSYFEPGESEQVISERKYNSQGFVTSQTITTNYIQPAGPSQAVEMTYEYIQL